MAVAYLPTNKVQLTAPDTVATWTPPAGGSARAGWVVVDDAGAVGVVTLTGGALAVSSILAPVRRVPTDGDDLAVWTCNETSGVTLANSGASGAGANLTAVAPFVLGGAGVFDRAIRFSGGLARGAQSLQPAAPITVSFWVRVGSFPAAPTLYARLLCRPVNNYADPFMTVALTLNSTGTVAAEVNSAVAGTSVPITSTESLGLGSWHHVGQSYDGATQSLYIDGTLVATQARAVVLGYTGNVNDVWALATNPAAVESTLDGRMDDVRIADVARSADWFREVYQRGVGLWTP